MTLEGWGHTSLFLWSCVDRTVSNYLLTSKIPSTGASCQQDVAPFADTLAEPISSGKISSQAAKPKDDKVDARQQMMQNILGHKSRTECLLDWAENNYSKLFSPAGAKSQFQSPFTYRYYSQTNSYVGVSASDNHVYYLGPERVLVDAGDLYGWLTKASCL